MSRLHRQHGCGESSRAQILHGDVGGVFEEATGGEGVDGEAMSKNGENSSDVNGDACPENGKHNSSN